MQIPTIRKGFKLKFEPLERDSKHLNETSNYSKVIRNIRMQILTIRKGFEAFESEFEPLVRDSKHSNAKI